MRRAFDDQWGRTAIYVAVGYALIELALTVSAAKNDPTVHNWANFLTFLGLLRWAALGIAAVMVGPALLEDAQRGALELYLSRSLSRRDYVVGKTAAVVLLTLAVVWIPALLYVG